MIGQLLIKISYRLIVINKSRLIMVYSDVTIVNNLFNGPFH